MCCRILFQHRRREILTYTIAQMNPENSMLSKLRKIQKDKYYMIPLPRDPWKRQVHSDRK